MYDYHHCALGYRLGFGGRNNMKGSLLSETSPRLFQQPRKMIQSIFFFFFTQDGTDLKDCGEHLFHCIPIVVFLLILNLTDSTEKAYKFPSIQITLD